MVRWAFIIAGCLSGCSTTQEKAKEEATPVVQVVKNEDKDKYIDKIESEVADAGAALTAAVRVDPPHRPLIELTITRLAGVKPPLSAKVDEYVRAKIDPKLLQAEKDKASKVNADTDAIWQKVELKDKENSELKERMILMEQRHKQEKEEERMATMVSSITKTCQWLGSIVLLAGVGLLVAGSLIGKPSKAGGLCILVGGSVILLPMLIPTIITASWFGYSVGGILVISIGWAMWDARHTHSSLKCRVRVPEEGLNTAP